MLRLWFGPTLANVIDVSPLALEAEYGQNFALASDLAGNLHRINFSSERYPVMARVLLSTAQLGLADGNENTLRERLLSCLANGSTVTAFIETTNEAYQLVVTGATPQLLSDTELSEAASREPLEVAAVILDNGTFTDFDTFGSVIWRGRNQ